MSFAIVVPCYNEADRWNPGYWTEVTENESVKWLFVDDGSTDSTVKCVTPLLGRTNVALLQLAVNAGKAEAVRQGMLHILGDGTEQISGLGYLDADGAFSPNVVGQILTSFRDHTQSESSLDAVWSSRVALAGRQIHRRNSRHYLGRIIATFAAYGTESFPYDTQSGLKVFVPANDLERCLEKPFTTRWLFEIELLSRWHAITGQAMRIWEEPVLSWIEIAGSKINARESFRIARELVAVKKVQRSGRVTVLGQPAGRE